MFAARAVTFAVAVLVTGAGCDSAFRFDQPATSATDGGPQDDGALDAGPRICTDDSTCGGLRCQVSTGACVACVANADCSGARSKCDTTMGICVECNGTTDCPARQGCDTVTKRCLDLCGDGDDCSVVQGFSCGEKPPVAGVCIECTQKENCVDPLSPRCDLQIGRCVGCTGNAQCTNATKPVCDRRSGRCEACVTSAECPGGFVCDPATLTCRQVP